MTGVIGNVGICDSALSMSKIAEHELLVEEKVKNFGLSFFFSD